MSERGAEQGDQQADRRSRRGSALTRAASSRPAASGDPLQARGPREALTSTTSPAAAPRAAAASAASTSATETDSPDQAAASIAPARIASGARSRRRPAGRRRARDQAAERLVLRGRGLAPARASRPAPPRCAGRPPTADQRLQRGPHRLRVGVVRVVDDGHAVRPRRRPPSASGSTAAPPPARAATAATVNPACSATAAAASAFADLVRADAGRAARAPTRSARPA